MNAYRHVLRTSPGAPLRASAVPHTSHISSPATSRLLSSRASRVNTTEIRTSPATPISAHEIPLLRSPFTPNTIQARSFHASSRALQQQEQPKQQTPETESKAQDESTEKKESKSEEAKEEGEKQEGEPKKEKKEDAPPPPPHGDKTPWQVFMETMQTEFKQSQEWNESTKALAASANQIAESEAIRRARQAYEATSGTVSSTAGKVVKTTATAVGKGAQWTWETPVMKGVRKGANITGEVLDKATKPIRETEAYKNVKEVIDDGSSSRYGGWAEKEERRKRREKWLKESAGKGPQVFEEDPNAGANIVVHKDAAWKEAWRDFRDSNKFVQNVFGLKTVYEESENPLISTARSITDKIGSFFAENETAQVIKKLRQLDPGFNMENFLMELREYILPEVLEAYVKGDVETLKLWLSEAQYSVYEALTKQYLQAGLKSDGRILDIRGVDVLKARMLDPGDIPVFVITCRTQEVHVYKNAKTGKLAAGMEDKVQLVTYAIGITRIPEDVNNPETRGWRLIEMQKSGRDYI